MNTKPVIAVDIDDVLADNAAGFIEWSNQKFGTQLTSNSYHEHWGEMWEIGREQAEQRANEFHEDAVVGTYEIVPDALEALELMKTRFTLILLTSRRLSIENVTRTWISKNYPDIFTDCVFCGFYDTRGASGLHLTKAMHAKNINAEYIIDDQLKHIEAAAEAGIKGLLFGDYLWNKKDKLPDNVTRVKDWSDILKYFDLK